MTIEPITAEDDVAWNGGQPHRLPPTDALVAASDQATTLWWTYLADSRTLFVQYNVVEGGIGTIADEILARAKQDDVARVVVDLRHNGGGDNTTLGPLEFALRDPAINRPGRLYVIDRPDHVLGRRQLRDRPRAARRRRRSPARRWAAARTSTATPAGSTCRTAARRCSWRRATGSGARRTTSGSRSSRTIRADLSSADYFAGRDPVLQAILDTPVAPGLSQTGGHGAARAAMLDVIDADRARTCSIVGGTVVTATGSRRADVAVRGGSIEADRGRPRPGWLAGAREVVDADGLLVLPGCVDVHTHTRVASDAEPDRFCQDSLAAAFGGTTTFLAFNNPGTGSSPAAHRSILAGIDEFRRVTASDSAVDFAAEPGDPRRDGRPAGRAAGDGRRGRPDGQGVHGLRLPAGRPRDLRRDADPRRARRDARGPLRGPGPDRRRGRFSASAW